jgi:HAD superfamily hydrolase (TIGR01509 family)
MLNENIKLIVFDCYDTLLSIKSNQAYKNYFSSLKNNFSFDKENINYLYSLVLNEKNINWSKVIQSLTNQNLDEKSLLKLKEFLSQLDSDLKIDNESIQAYSDINTLSILKKDYKLALFSNLAQGYEQKIGEFLLPFFDKIYLSFEIGYQKPYKEGFEKIKDDFHLNFENIALIDDKIVNIKAAQDLGMQGILIDRHLKHINAINTITQLLY